MSQKRKAILCAVIMYIFYKVYMGIVHFIYSCIISMEVSFSTLEAGMTLTTDEMTKIFNEKYFYYRYQAAIIYELIFIVLLIYILKLRLFEKRKLNKNLVVAFLIGAFYSVAITVVLNFLPQNIIKEYVLDYLQVFPEYTVISLFYIIIFQPVFEEIFFRKALYSQLKEGIGRIVAILLSAFLFALEHGNWIWFIYTFILAIIISIYYEKTQDFRTCIVAHIAFNFWGIII